MAYLTLEDIRRWVESQDQEDEAYYCEWCFTKLVQTDEGLWWYCPNEMCLYNNLDEITEEE